MKAGKDRLRIKALPKDVYSIGGRGSRPMRPFLWPFLLLCLLVSPAAAEEPPVLVDMQPPQITVVQPADGATVDTGRPWLEAEVTDRDSGIEREGIVLSLDGVDVTAHAIVERLDLQEIGVARMWRIRYQPAVALAPGQHRAQIDAADKAGNIARRQWVFHVREAEPRVSWDAGLTNTMAYSYLPVEKFDNTINFASRLQLPAQRLTLQVQASVADYPGLVIEPNLGDYYFYLDRYAFGWQTEHFALQYGDINLPFAAGLLQLGLGFSGICFESGGRDKQAPQWTFFHGAAASSFGLGISITETTGGICRWRTEAGYSQAYLLQMESGDSARVVGFQDDRAFAQGVLRYELAYGQDEAGGGGGVNIQVGGALAGIFWEADLIAIQGSYPLLSASPLSSTDGGAYRYSIGGEKLLPDQRRISFGYSRLEDNLDGSEEHTQESQSLRLEYTGSFKPGFDWTLGYQGGWRQEYGGSAQQAIEFGINRKMDEDAWSSNLSFSRNDAELKSTERYQWNIGYTKPFIRAGLKTTALLQLTYEDEEDSARGQGLELRLTAEKQLFQDMARSYLVIAYKTNQATDSAGAFSGRAVLDLQSSLNLRLGQDNSLSFSGKISFWRNEAALSSHGTDYGFGLAWQSRFF